MTDIVDRLQSAPGGLDEAEELALLREAADYIARLRNAIFVASIAAGTTSNITVIRNLLDNAAKIATPDGPSCAACAHEADGDCFFAGPCDDHSAWAAKASQIEVPHD